MKLYSGYVGILLNLYIYFDLVSCNSSNDYLSMQLIHINLTIEL